MRHAQPGEHVAREPNSDGQSRTEFSEWNDYRKRDPVPEPPCGKQHADGRFGKISQVLQ